jgi:hypothetical protein
MGRKKLGCEMLEHRCLLTGFATALNGLDYLGDIMDQYHDDVAVFEDISSAGNHFHGRQKLPDENALVTINGSSTVKVHSGATAIRNVFSTSAGDPFGGFYFQNGLLPAGETAPLLNFGDTPNAGLNLNGVKAISFWAAGANGGERVEFFVAGVGRDAATGLPIAPFPDSSRRVPGQGVVSQLSQQWKQFRIDLTGRNMSYVLGGFGWVASAAANPSGVDFFVDDIVYELTAAAQEARLNQPRLLRSFTTRDVQPDIDDVDTTDDIDFVLRNAASSYDNALAVLAFIAEGSDESLRRARLIGDALVYATLHDRTFDEGFLRSFYQAGDIALPPGWTPNNRPGAAPIPGFYLEETAMFYEIEQQAIDTGNNAWSMIALLALHRATPGDTLYLDAAERIGEFLLTMKNSSGTFQGFAGGLEKTDPQAPEAIANFAKRPWASTEHNLDLIAAFTLMFQVTGDAKWNDAAIHARAFVDSMWKDQGSGVSCLLTGTLDVDQRNENVNQLPLDVQAWFVLAVPDAIEQHEQAIACAETHHRTSTLGFDGFDFNNDRDGVWPEGTGQMAVAYAFSGRSVDAERFKRELSRLQSTAPYGDGSAVAASVSEVLTTGFQTAGSLPFNCFRRFHVGATAWAAVFAQLGFNPYYQTYAPRIWTNPVDPLDVSDNQVVTVFDALLIINQLNLSRGASDLPSPPKTSPPYLDVNGNGRITPFDALLVINELNARASGLSGQTAAATGLQVTSDNDSSTIWSRRFKIRVSLLNPAEEEGSEDGRSQS